MAYSRSQKRIQRAIIEEGRKMGMPRKAILSALATGITESNFSEPGEGASDRDSAGWRQERRSSYPGADRFDERAAARRYYQEWKSDAPKRGPIGPMAQAVQQSGFPGRYQTHADEARSILKSFGGRGRPQRRGLATPGGTTFQTTQIPGVDNSALRDQLKQQYLLNRDDPDALLSLGLGLRDNPDVPASSLTSRLETGGFAAPQGDGGRDRRDKRGRIITGTGRSVQRMLQMAEGWDRKKVPYLWGGGHGSIAKVGDRVDCSGFVSAVLGIDTPMVSGALAGWGKPGKGRHVTVYANDGHVLMSIRDPRSKKVRWFGTSRSNPGGGAGEISQPDASYLSGFTARHP
jgi:hypothetical protein